MIYAVWIRRNWTCLHVDWVCLEDGYSKNSHLAYSISIKDHEVTILLLYFDPLLTFEVLSAQQMRELCIHVFMQSNDKFYVLCVCNE